MPLTTCLIALDNRPGGEGEVGYDVSKEPWPVGVVVGPHLGPAAWLKQLSVAQGDEVLEAACSLRHEEELLDLAELQLSHP